jgi:HSP20 family molecular chaperone IbpA
MIALTCGLLVYLPSTSFGQDTPAGNDPQNSSPGFTDKMKTWQNEMSDKFSDTFKDLRRDLKNPEKTIAMVSVDLREKNDSYVLRLNLPDRDVQKTEVKLQGGNLTIVVPAEGEAGRYEQTMALADIAADAQPAIERKQDRNLILVTIPKQGSGLQAQAEADAKASEEFDRDIINRMDRMRREMDRMAREAFEGFRDRPGHRGLFDESRFGSSVVLQDQGSNYVVRAYLPGRELKDLNVSVENQTLKLEAKAEGSNEKKFDGVVSSYKANYLQELTLPGPVLTDKMKVDRKDQMVVITLPKVNSAQ